MDLELSGRVAVVTGASVGIGRSIARVLAAEGAQTVIVARRAALLESLGEEIAATGAARPMAVVADLYDRDAPIRVARSVLERLGRADIVVNNAGGSRNLAIDSPDAAWDEALALNFTSVRKMAHAFLPTMIERRWGRVVNITGSLEPPVINGANVAKAGVHAWAKGLSREVARHGVTVNCMMPGRIHSEQIDERMYPTEQDRQRYIEQHIPIGYFGEPEDVAYAVAFLCSTKARYVTGQRMYIDGGMHRAL